MSSFYFPSTSQQKFPPISFKLQQLETSPKKQKEQRQKQLFFLVSFPFLYILNYLQSSLTVYVFAKFCLSVKETAEIETGMAEKSVRDQANVWKN
jgi:hypothetical protein